MTILNITKGKNKVITSGLAGALSALIFLTAIHIAAKIAIIVAAAAVTYLLLSLIHKIRTKKEQPAEIIGASGDKVSADEGYSSVGEGEEKDTEISIEEPKTELAEELKNKRAEEKMKNGLPERMDCKGNSLAGADDTSQTKYVTNYMDLMQSLPEHMDVLGNPLSKQPPSNLTVELGSKSTQKLSAAEWLSRYGGVTNNSMRIPERQL